MDFTTKPQTLIFHMFAQFVKVDLSIWLCTSKVMCPILSSLELVNLSNNIVGEINREGGGVEVYCR
jgi:hypothetical protein